MAQLLIDTDVLIDYLREQPESVAYLEELSLPLYVSAVTVAELYAGVRDGRERVALDQFVRSFRIVAIDEEIAVRAGNPSKRLREKSRDRSCGRHHRSHRSDATSETGDAERQALSDA